MSTKRVVIAHQSTIPHYRIPFFNAMERRRPPDWRFEVAFDPAEFESPTVFKEPVDRSAMDFPILDAPLLSLRVRGRTLRYQRFLAAARRADLAIVEHAVNNLAYPAAAALRPAGVKVAYWGHGRDLKDRSPSAAKRLSERFKHHLARSADGYFAYTDEVKQYLTDRGAEPDRVFVVQNTIDIETDHRHAMAVAADRATTRRSMGLPEEAMALLFIGRPNPEKRLDYLLDAFETLRAGDDGDRFRLLLVGPDADILAGRSHDGVTALGPIAEHERLAPIYSACDVFVHPGAVGLAPLQAMAHGLPVVTVASAYHKPEFGYLNERNSLVLPAATSPSDYGRALAELAGSPLLGPEARHGIWDSVSHLTVDRMADNFIEGIDRLLATGRSGRAGATG